MGLSTSDLVRGFRGVGVEQGDSILVHSSLSSLGWVDGGAETVIDSLIESVGPSGTVLFPTLTGSRENSRATPPIFDARLTKCWTGRIPETARLRESALRSLHPTHSVVAFGRLAEWFVKGHEFARTPCGYGSPYDKLADIGGKIVLIGVEQHTNTSFHHAEELAEAPYVNVPESVDVVMTDMHGNKVEMRDICVHMWGPDRDYDALERPMLDLGICRIGTVGKATVRVMDAMLQRMFLLRKLLNDRCAVLALHEREKWAQVSH